MTTNPCELLERLEELQDQNGKLSVANITFANVAYPDRYPDYATVLRIFGGIRKVKRILGEDKRRKMAMSAYLQSCQAT